MRPSLLIAGLAFILFWSSASYAQCSFSKAVYRLPNNAPWELTVPHLRDDAIIDEPVATLKYTETGKTYLFGWMVTTGVGAEYLSPLSSNKGSRDRESTNASLRLYTLQGGVLLNGLPDANAPAPEGLFIEGLDIHIRYADIDQLEFPVGFWQFAECR